MTDTITLIDRHIRRVHRLMQQAKADGKPVNGYQTTIDTLLEQRIKYTLKEADA